MTFKTHKQTDLATFFNVDEFAESCTYFFSSGAEKTILLIPGSVQDATPFESGQADVMGASVLSSEVEEPERGDIVQIGTVFWRVGSVSGGDGIWTLGLSKDPRHAR
jgi:hypothetical protein